jgi:transposase-like protein
LDLPPNWDKRLRLDIHRKESLSDGIVSQAVHERVQAEGRAARALEVNVNVPHRWRREFRQGPGNALPGNGKQRWSQGRIAGIGAANRFFVLEPVKKVAISAGESRGH